MGQPVGDIGEGRGTFVSGDHQVGVVAIMADHIGRWHDFTLIQIVGQIQQPPDKRLIAGDALFPQGLPGAIFRRLFDDEPALGTDGHNHRVLHLLGLYQAENFGAVVLTAVGPAQPAPGHRACPEVYPFHSG